MSNNILLCLSWEDWKGPKCSSTGTDQINYITFICWNPMQLLKGVLYALIRNEKRYLFL